MSVAQIYDFEAAVEGGIVAALTAAGIISYSSQDALLQQKPRPRVEVCFTLGSGGQRYVVIDPTTGAAIPDGTANAEIYMRESAWDCTITMSLITAANMADHTSYRATIRNKMAHIWILINGTEPMTRHRFRMVRDGGSSALMMDQGRGFFKTDFTYHGKLTIQADAWPALGEA